MASSPGKWEVAGKDGRARKNTSGNKKNKQKLNEADLPKLDIKGEPVDFYAFMNVPTQVSSTRVCTFEP